ncbi:MAG: 4-hydroxy-tetrahydrodipicolinate reductase [Chitinophagaceae bacterium]
MKIALVGYGKMGQAIEAIAVERGHEIVLTIDVTNRERFTKENMAIADVAIEFTSPHSAVENILRCLEYETPVVCGSTGWLAELPEIETALYKYNGGFLYASNFSLGVNIFFEVNKLLARLMAGQTAYDVEMTEVHHTHKKDAPSGTAITLAEQILAVDYNKKQWVNEPSGSKDDLFIESQRVDPAPGTHIVTWSSAIDDIEIKHTAHSRTGFALGAVLAAEFLQGKKGMFTMKDVLGL